MAHHDVDLSPRRVSGLLATASRHGGPDGLFRASSWRSPVYVIVVTYTGCR
ncbi:hypothetical protein [Streptomyces microflavus]|uniref:hypothetical protein n=1 Tax=Streptomyces microflavus TaxID=1919 RepID=UPI00369BE73C